MPKQSLPKRLQSFFQDRWFKLKLLVRFHWPALFLIILIVSIAAYWSRFLLPRADYQSAQLTMSTEVQSLAALLGIMLVGVTILWSQATGEEARLMELQPKYYELLRGSDPAHNSPPAIERLRLDYLKKIKGHSLPRQVFPYKHPKYPRHRDLFLDICRLSDLVHDTAAWDRRWTRLKETSRSWVLPKQK
jgi:hypothetical protein